MPVLFGKRCRVGHIMNIHQLAGQNMGRVFNFQSGYVLAEHSCCYEVKVANLKLKTWPKTLRFSPVSLVRSSKLGLPRDGKNGLLMTQKFYSRNLQIFIIS
jgi:hypothetical protein